MTDASHSFLAYGEESSRVAAWADRAYVALIDLIDSGKLDQFMVEDVRDDICQVAGEPGDPRWLGLVSRRLHSEDRVKFVTYRPSKQARAHKRPTAVWKAVAA